MEYIKFNDPGHGWLRVKTEELRTLGIEDKITGYSYISDDGRFVYLEEDQDMGTFVKAKWGGYENAPTFKQKHTDGSSSIRRKNPYTPPLPFAA